MLDLIKKFFTPPVFENDDEKTIAAELLHTILTAVYLLVILIFIGLAVGGRQPRATFVIIAIFFMLLIALQIPMRKGYVTQASIVFVALMTVTLTITLVLGGTVRAPAVTFFILASVMSGLLINRQAIFWSAAVNVLIIFGLIWGEINGLLHQSNYEVNAQQGIIFTAASILTAILLNLALRRLNQSLERARYDEKELSKLNVELETRVEERTAELEKSTQQSELRAEQLEIIADVARSIAAYQNLEELLPTITKLVSERFGFYHVGIFLLNVGKDIAILRAANSEGGQRMIARRHQLRVGIEGIVGFAISRGQARIALDVGSDAIYFNNPELPETHSEIALPLKFGDAIIGALDIQSIEKNAFSQENMRIFSILANQISVAIQNAQSLEQAQRALTEADRATSQLTGQAWETFSRTRSIKGFYFDGNSSHPMKQSRKESQKGSLRIPIKIHGKDVASLTLGAPEPNYQWTETQIAMAQAAAERAALALENARLLDDAQRRASREQTLGEIASKIGSFTDTEAILRATVNEIGHKIGGAKVIFELGSQDEARKQNKSQ